MKPILFSSLTLCSLALCLPDRCDAAAQPGSRRSQRVNMEQVQVVSPDDQVKFTLLPNAERLTFTVTMGDTTVIEPSTLSMKLDDYDLSSGVVFGKAESFEINETYAWSGDFSIATNQCRGTRITLTHDLSLIPYALEVRAFKDGVAFRHIMPGDQTAPRVPDEYSTFVLPTDSTVWYTGLAAGHYEDTYRQKHILEVQPGEWSAPPLTFKLPNGAGYASVTEANLVEYSGMGLESDGRRGWVVGLGHRHPLNYPFELRYGREEGKRLGKPAVVQGTITTPWRVVLVGRDLNTLVNSSILPNLCPPPDAKLFPEGLKTAWVKPGRAVWRYLDGGPSGVEGMKEFSRLAAQLGFQHHVIEGFWGRWSMDERKAVVNYSKNLGVGLWFWKHSKELRTPAAREEFFKMLNELGVVGAKIDFMDHEHKEIVDLYEALLRKAAEYRVMVNFHGANKPTGRERTLPNDMVREAVKGMEASRLTERARHQATLPFTRCLAGAADYTTMIFSQRRGDTTWANQIASLAIFNSPLLTIAAHPQSILDNPAVDVIKSIPSVWDQTIVLPGSEIGELALFVRRSGDTWFVAAMCGEKPTSYNVPLTFLGGGQYQAVIVRDGETDASVSIDRSARSNGDALKGELRAGGGFVARLERR